MNDKWFNIAMLIVFTSLIANGLIFMLTAFPNGNQFTTLHQNNLDYNNGATSISNTYGYKIDGSKITPDSSTTTSTGTLITTLTGDPFGLSPLNLIASAFVGLEALLLTLANIFTMFAVLFILMALFAFTVKVIVAAYFASIIVRSILGWLA